jgi:hypothetical protein
VIVISNKNSRNSRNSNSAEAKVQNSKIAVMQKCKNSNITAPIIESGDEEILREAQKRV